MIAEYTHDATFPGKAIYNVWDFILYIWGLEVYLYIKHDNGDKAEYRIKKIDGILKVPLPKAYSSYDRQLFVEGKASGEVYLSFETSMPTETIITSTSDEKCDASSTERLTFVALFHINRLAVFN